MKDECSSVLNGVGGVQNQFVLKRKMLCIGKYKIHEATQATLTAMSAVNEHTMPDK